jgi:hypothetical protein
MADNDRKCEQKRHKQVPKEVETQKSGLFVGELSFLTFSGCLTILGP